MNRLINAALFLAPFLLAEAVCRFLPVASMPVLLPVTAGAPVAHMQPNVEYTYSRDWNFKIHQRKRSNNFGYVNEVDYQPDAASPLLAVIGDSYVEAQGVPPGENIAEVLHQRVSPKGRVYSIGLSGAPLSQYMMFAQFARDSLHPAAMAFVIINNDFDESLLKYKSDPRFHYFDASGELRRVDYEMSTLKKILRHSAFIRYVVLNLEMERAGQTIRAALRPSAGSMPEERTEDSYMAIVYFLDQLPARAGLPANSIVFVLDAVRPAIYSPEALQKAGDGYHARMRRYFTEQATARGYNVIDMQPVFMARNRSDGSRFELAPTDSHWNAAAHRLAADEVEKSAPFKRLFSTSAVARSH